MRRKRARLSNRLQRPVLSDTLPFEVPASFSNRHFCNVLVRYNVRLSDGGLLWECDSDELDTLMRLLSGVPAAEPITTYQNKLFGKIHNLRLLKIATHNLVTMPFQFEICHKSDEARRLSIPHPLNQLAVAQFYNDHADTITYFAGLSPFSIRRPVSISRFSNFRDRLHTKLLAEAAGSIEEKGKEYDQLGSFFVYHTYSNIFKFFESYRYHRSEKRFDAMAKIDISKCFDSIYTHSLPWAIHGNRAIKDDLVRSKSTFAGDFDALMRNLNQNETNGIIIGPEFSRVFAELILQSADTALEKRLRYKHRMIHKRDYEIFRYVDDYFIFFNKRSELDLVVENLRHFLSEMKLHINADKTKVYEKPVITEITIAKNEIALLIENGVISSANEEVPGSIDGHTGEDGPESEGNTPKLFRAHIDSRDLIIKYKSTLKMSGVSYLDVGNYTFALLESKVDEMISNYIKSERSNKSQNDLVRCLTSIMEFAFFIYASAPRVNLSIRIARIITVVARAGLFSSLN